MAGRRGEDEYFFILIKIRISNYFALIFTRPVVPNALEYLSGERQKHAMRKVPSVYKRNDKIYKYNKIKISFWMTLILIRIFSNYQRAFFNYYYITNDNLNVYQMVLL